VLSLYAPTPKLTFIGDESFLKACVTPRIASGGASGTFFHQTLSLILFSPPVQVHENLITEYTVGEDTR